MNAKNLAPRVIFVALSFAVTVGVTVALFLLVPAIHDSLTMAISEGGRIFIGVVIFPAVILSLIATWWAIPDVVGIHFWQTPRDYRERLIDPHRSGRFSRGFG